MVQQGMVALLKGASRRFGGSSAAEMSTLLPSMFNLPRAFSSKLFVGGLSYHTTEDMLRKAFAEHGDVVDARIITDRETGRSRGFGFVSFNSDSDAEAAKAKMSNHLLDGRFIRVDLASCRPPQSPASPQPSGNAASSSSSSSGFSFGTPGTRPPPVEDWGPLPVHGAHATQTTSGQGAFESLASTPYQGSVDTFSSGSSPANSTSDADLTANEFPVENTSASTGQSFASCTSSEAGTGPAQTAKAKQENNYSSSSRTGFRSGGGRPPSVLNLGSATYDFSNFPEFDASIFKNFKPPGELEEPKKHVQFHRNKLAPQKAETWQSKLTEEAIPPAEGPLFDFGLGGILDSPPSSDAGYNLHGGFSLNVNLDDLPEAEPVRLPYSIFTARTLPPLDLPWLTPEADNWSPIGKPPRRIEDSPYSPFSPDLKDDPEFWWDPYDFDPEAKLLKEAFTEEPTMEANATKETQGEAKKHDESEAKPKVIKELEAEAKVSKEPQAGEVPDEA